MKKYISVLFIIVFLISVVSPTFAVSESVNDAMRAEIVALLEKYNKYVLVRNLCVGSIGSEYGNNVFYSIDIPILDWFTKDFTHPDYEITSPTPIMYAGDKCVKIDDVRFHHHNDFKDMLYDIYTKASAEIFYASEFAYSYPLGDYGCIYKGFSNHPLFITINGELYTTEPLKDNVVLTKRYIDLSMLSIDASSKGYVVKARGSSLFKDGEVQEPDSDVKILIVEEDGKLKIDYMEAISDYNKIDGFSKLSDEEKFNTLIDKIVLFNELSNSCIKANSKFNLSYIQNSMVVYCDYYLVESDRFRNMADLYDWAYGVFLDDKVVDVYYGDHPEYIYHQYLSYGNYDSCGYEKPRFFYYGSFLYSIDQKPFWLLEKINDIKILPYENGYVGYVYNREHFFYYFDKVDLFGDGEYEFRISNIVRKFNFELTDEDRTLFGITE